MRNLGPKEAANAIRGTFFSDRSSRMDPEQAHQMKFAKEVTRELGGGDDSPETVAHVMQLLREHDIELHAGHEFPKYATRKWDRTAKIVHSEEEEHSWVNEAEPPPPNPDDLPPARTLDAPVQDLSIDLKDKVPHMVSDAPAAERPARIPSAVTNREAAQDAYARQPVESKDRDAAAAAYDDGDFEQDDGDVHIEDVHTEEVGLDALAPGGSSQQGGAPYAKPAPVGVMANDDPDGDGIAGQDKNPTHDSELGTDKPQNKSGDSSAGKTDTTRRPVGNRRPQ